jgi:hypothetical protein
MTKSDLKVEQMAVDRLLPYARNARTHSDAQVAQIAASITEFGWTNPLLVDENGGIIAGHGRLLAARKLGMAKVPVIVRGGLTETQKRALVLADNKLALNAGWDEAMLANELAALIEDGYDAGLSGFEQSEIEDLIARASTPSGESAGGGEGQSDGPPSGAGSLAARFGVPPFTVLSAREGWWQTRKQAWVALGIQSELGRGDGGKAGAIRRRSAGSHRDDRRCGACDGATT